MNARLFIRGTAATTEKNIRIYYNKAPVIIFGLMFPIFMFIAFYLGRDIELPLFVPGFLAMTLFFTSSSVGPLITPWEKQAGTYERLLSFPVSLYTILFGDLIAGALFGLMITSVVFVGIVALVGVTVSHAALLVLSMLLGTVCFSSLGVLIASPASPSPPNIMMLSSLVRFPLIFISGVFVPLVQLTGPGKVLTYFSPLTYLVDLANSCLGNTSVLAPALDLAALCVFSVGFTVVAHYFQKRNLMKGI